MNFIIASLVVATLFAPLVVASVIAFASAVAEEVRAL